MGLVSFLYKLARKANDVSAAVDLIKGKPKHFIKRMVNKQIGKKIARRMFWKYGATMSDHSNGIFGIVGKVITVLTIGIFIWLGAKIVKLMSERKNEG